MVRVTGMPTSAYSSAHWHACAFWTPQIRLLSPSFDTFRKESSQNYFGLLVLRFATIYTTVVTICTTFCNRKRLYILLTQCNHFTVETRATLFLCLIKHDGLKTYGGMKVWLHSFIVFRSRPLFERLEGVSRKGGRSRTRAA